MPDAMIQVRVDADLFEAAKSAGADADRSAAAQIRHWARIGREFENAEDAQDFANPDHRSEDTSQQTGRRCDPQV